MQVIQILQCMKRQRQREKGRLERDYRKHEREKVLIDHAKNRRFAAISPPSKPLKELEFMPHEPNPPFDQSVVSLEREAIEAAAMGKQGMCVHDVEACYPPGHGGGMYPYMIESPQLRWAFIRKVYVIVALQLLVTVAVAAAVNLTDAIRSFFLSRTPASLAAFVLIIISPIIVMLPMIYFRNRHPINLVFLFLFTVCISFSVGLGCLSAKGIVIFEAASITLVVVVGLTGYTFWAAKRGHDFEFLGPFLVAACLVLMLYALVQILFPMGKTATMVYGCIAALVFSGFIIYDTDNLIKRYTYDEYVAAAITLYLDIINLFMALVTALEAAD